MVAKVHHRGCLSGRGRGHYGRLAWRSACLVLVMVVLRGAGRDTVLGQELFQVHVLELEGVSIVGQGFVPQRGAQEG